MKTVTYDETKWQMVPKVPTEEMKDAAMDILLHHGDIYANSWGSIVIETITPADLLRAMLKAAPTPPEVEQAQPDIIPSFDELERRYFPEGRKKRLEWEAEQRALIWRRSTLDAQVRPVVNQQMTIGVDQSFVNLTPETAAYTTAQPSAQGETVYRSADILKAFNNGFDMGLRQRTSQDRKDDSTLADTQRQIIEAAERRGYARALAECGQDREDAKRYTWLRDHPPKDCQGGMRVMIWWESGDWTSISGEKLDAAIDAAWAAKEE